MKIIRLLVLLSIALYLSGCAVKSTLPNNVVVEFKKIGVVSQTAATLYKQHVGLTIFGNDYEPQDILEWKIDEVYAEQLASELQSTLNIEPVILNKAQLDFGEVNSLTGPYSAPAFWGPNFSAIKDVTLKACVEYNLDALFIVTRFQTSDFIGMTNQKLEGAGIYSRRGNSVIHLLSKIGVMDCKSGKVLAVGTLKNESASSESFLYQYPKAQIDSKLAQKAFSEWNQEEKDNLRRTLLDLAKDAWRVTLRSMFPSSKSPN
ncbi:MAG: hypothetical protein NWQ54_11870 [Paraglaciecola sp.]|uniref:hypothetical protein n=1 Tax=Paraglaciecola sp. TaxID=1920173 RepID=UPI00273E28C4|nr:hypothetical protein [Paraglaciecola sp.]MDP5029984.1 hypothetical protein [Paraglaciecola sp.]MDP5131575.1 hypothetical protein [Paraglaciecola sp.]